MQELDSLHYAVQTMQELDSIHCDRARVRTNNEGKVVVVVR